MLAIQQDPQRRIVQQEGAPPQLNPEQRAVVQEALAREPVVIYQQINNPPAGAFQSFANGFFITLGGAVAATATAVTWVGVKSLFFYCVEEISRRQAMKWLAKELVEAAVKKTIVGVRV